MGSVKMHPCSECPELIPLDKKTCSSKCRSKRSRRLRRMAKERGAQSPYSPEVQAIQQAAADEVQDVAHEVLRDALAPIVRESLTEEVLQTIGTMVNTHLGTAVQVLAEQMQSDDETIAQRAATLFLKYTMGNPSVAPGPAAAQPAPMQVVFNVPRPGDTTPEVEPQHSVTAALDDGDAEELRECGDCHKLKVEQDFEAGSETCVECFEARHAKVVDRLAKKDATAP